MRSAFVLLLLLGAGMTHAEIGSIEECGAAISADPESARENAAVWYHSGGGLPARLCEAAALEEMGAYATAARLLTGMAENPNRAMDTELRSTLFADGARLWLDAGQPDLALAAWTRSLDLTPDQPVDGVLAARIHAANGDWGQTVTVLTEHVTAHPGDATALALLAAAERRNGNPAEALKAADAAMEAAPYSPIAMFELGAAQAEMGMFDEATETWDRFVTLHPEHDLADAARRNIDAIR